jgi:hypothetical protein
MLRNVVSQKLTDVSQVPAAFIIRVMSKPRAKKEVKKLEQAGPGQAINALMMEAVSNSETVVNFYETTRRNIPEDSHLCS